MEYLDVLLALLQNGGEAATKNGGQESWVSQLLMCGLLGIGFLAIYYFLIIKPKQDEQKEKEEMLEALNKKDDVLTIGGIHGTVEKIHDEEVTVVVDDQDDTQIKLAKWAIRENLTQKDEEEED